VPRSRNFKVRQQTHSKFALPHGGKGVMCEGLDGAGKEHIDFSVDTSKILSISRATAEQIEGRCLTRQQGDHEMFERSALSSFATS
jgi:hypothetical protein